MKKAIKKIIAIIGLSLLLANFSLAYTKEDAIIFLKSYKIYEFVGGDIISICSVYTLSKFKTSNRFMVRMNAKEVSEGIYVVTVPIIATSPSSKAIISNKDVKKINTNKYKLHFDWLVDLTKRKLTVYNELSKESLLLFDSTVGDFMRHKGLH